MRIAIFHELDFGGARRAVQELGKRLNVILDVDLYYVDSEKEKNIDKNYKNIFYYPFYPKYWNGSNWRIKLYKDTLELISLYNLHKKITYDIKSRNYEYVFVHPSKFTQSPFLLRFLENCIYYCQEPLRMVYDQSLSDISDIKFPKNIYEFLNRWIRKWIDRDNLENVNKILANSEFSKNFIEKSYGKKAQVCYLGVDADLFRPQNLNKTIDVLFIGNKDKGYALLYKSLKLFKTKPKLFAIFRNEKTKIADKELVKIYNNSKVLVALNKNEPFGLIPLEAMSCGVPVIAVGEGGYSESVLDGKTGYLISRNPDTLCEIINKIINNEKIRQEMGKKARENVLRNWTWNKSAERFLKIIKYGSN